MGISAGPDVIQKGLVLCLDAGDKNSYPGSGTTWKDISGRNNNGTLINGPTFSSANGGGIVFDGTNDVASSFSTQISGVESKTICTYIYPTSTARIGICGTRELSTATGWVLTVNRTATGNLTYFHTGGSIAQTNAGILTNQWYYVSVTYSTEASTVILYLNGVQLGSPFTSFSTMQPSSFTGNIGGEQQSVSTELFKGTIGSIQIYNRALSAAEILQNYNSQKSRFGLK